MMKDVLSKCCFVLLLCVAVSCTATREQEVEGDINEFRSWVNSQTSKLAERTEEDWKNTKEDFKRRTAELDSKQERFSDQLRADYQQLKEDFRERERERDRLTENRAKLGQWRQDLLGSYANVSTISTQQIKTAYTTFLENVRLREGSWSDKDWEMASLVLDELNDRKDALKELPDEDEVEIKALQMEFAALQTDDADNN